MGRVKIKEMFSEATIYKIIHSNTSFHVKYQVTGKV